jgi:hypothetical protein
VKTLDHPIDLFRYACLSLFARGSKLLNRFREQCVARSLLRDPRLLLGGSGGPVSDDESPDTKWRRYQRADDEKPAAQLRSRIGCLRGRSGQSARPDGRKQLPEGDDPADGDQEEDDKKNSIEGGGERYWRLGNLFPLKNSQPCAGPSSLPFPLVAISPPKIAIPLYSTAITGGSIRRVRGWLVPFAGRGSDNLLNMTCYTFTKYNYMPPRL